MTSIVLCRSLKNVEAYSLDAFRCLKCHIEFLNLYGGSTKNCTVIGQFIGGVVLRSASSPVSGSYSQN